MPPHSVQPVAIVTGASAGIGRAIGAALARDGYALALTARGEDRLLETAQAIVDETDVPVLPIVADAGSPADMEQLVEATVEQFGRLDVLVNNAAAGPRMPIGESDSVAFLETFVTNVFGPAAGIRAAWPTFVRQGFGRVINITSMAVRDPLDGFFVYAASKAALASFTRSINVEGKAHGIRAYSVGPGAVETELLRTIADEKTLPREACLEPSDVADLVLACLHGEHADAPSAEFYMWRGADGIVIVEGAPGNSR